jgi:hypothetical protein
MTNAADTMTTAERQETEQERLNAAALSEVAEMTTEAETILSHLADLKAGVEAKDATAIRKALTALSDETWGYSGGIIGFRPRTDAVYGLLEVVEDAEAR